MTSKRRAIDFHDFAGADEGAKTIVCQYQKWKDQRREWEAQKVELRQFVFQTDTRKTRVRTLPWMNTTTRPKLCQIRDNLHANYISALGLQGDFLRWVAAVQDDAVLEKARLMTAYVRTKMDESNARREIALCLYDYIDYGIAIAGVEYATEYVTNENGERTVLYSGPRMVRFDPMDVVFDLTAPSFEAAPKITRAVLTLGDLSRLARDCPEYQYDQTVIDKMMENRQNFRSLSERDRSRVTSFSVEGFGSLSEYYNSGFVELLSFEGDFYDVSSGTLYENYTIVVADRCHVIAKRQNASWFGKSSKRAVVWRPRPDNLMGMGPLDNLVGLQYRLDHLENMKNDALDQVAYPRVKEKGLVQDWTDEPGERIRMGDDGEVSYLVPDLSAMSLENQIAIIEASMEEMAGAPKTAMGIRTPGEKTAYEVQTLENAAGRIFQAKIQQFELELLEPIVNLFVESGRRMLDSSTIIRDIDDETGAVLFDTITKQDLVGKGRLTPMGSRHYAERARTVQELSTFFGPNGLGADPGVRVHFSGERLAKLFNTLLGLDSFNIYRKNAQVEESVETQLAQQAAMTAAEEVAATDSGLAGEAVGVTEAAAAEQLGAQGIDPAILEQL